MIEKRMKRFAKYYLMFVSICALPVSYWHFFQEWQNGGISLARAVIAAGLVSVFWGAVFQGAKSIYPEQDSDEEPN